MRHQHYEILSTDCFTSYVKPSRDPSRSKIVDVFERSSTRWNRTIQSISSTSTPNVQITSQLLLPAQWPLYSIPSRCCGRPLLPSLSSSSHVEIHKQQDSSLPNAFSNCGIKRHRFRDMPHSQSLTLSERSRSPPPQRRVPSFPRLPRRRWHIGYSEAQPVFLASSYSED